MENKKEYIFWDNVVAAALLKYGKITYLQLLCIFESLSKSPLAERFYLCRTIDFTDTTFYKIEDYIISIRNGTRTLEKPLDTRLCDIKSDFKDERTISSVLEETATKTIIDYLDQIDLSKITSKYDALIANNSADFIEKANVLVIGDSDESIVEGLRKFGFKNILVFKSHYVADDYFSKNPEAINSFQLILQGFTDTSCYNLKLWDFIRKYSAQKKIVFSDIDTCRHPYDATIYILNKNYMNEHYFRYEELDSLLQQIVNISLINHSDNLADFLASKPLPVIEAVPFLPSPKSKEELKVLCLNNDKKQEETYKEKYGVNVLFEDIPFLGSDTELMHSLSEYDIIIGSRIGHDPVTLIAEASYQAKTTGRKKILLLNYEINSCWQFPASKTGYEIRTIRLIYSFAGENSQEEVTVQSFKIVIPDISNMYSFILEAVINAALNIYNAELQKEKQEITSFEIPGIDKYTNEYEEVKAKIEEKDSLIRQERTKEYEPINNLDNLEDILKRFLDLRKRKVIRQSIPDLNIYEANDAIFVERLLNHQLLFSIIIPKQNRYENIRTFMIQVRSKKTGKMTSIEEVALFTKWAAADMQTGKLPKYNQPNELQKDALVSLMLKIKTDVEPLVTPKDKASKLTFTN